MMCSRMDSCIHKLVAIWIIQNYPPLLLMHTKVSSLYDDCRALNWLINCAVYRKRQVVQGCFSYFTI